MRLISTIVMSLISIVLCQPVSSAQVKSVLENDALKIVFSDKASGFDCLAIENKLAGNTRFIVPEGSALNWPGLWSITLSAPSCGGKRERLHINNKDSSGLKTANLQTSVAGEELVLQWKGMSLEEKEYCLDVTATISLANGEGPSEWRINFVNRSQKWGVDDVSYPILRTVCKKGTADVLLPSGSFGGKLKKNNTSAFYDTYPSGAPYCAFQLMAFNQGNAGLYMAAHDGQANVKIVSLTADQHATFKLLAENQGVAGADMLPLFPYVIAAYRGDWWTAAKMYRQWGLQQKWSRRGWLATRTDLPTKNFLDIGFWVHANAWSTESPASELLRRDMATICEAFAPLTVALHLYNWHVQPFDTNYPEFFPVKEHIPADIKRFQSQGLSVMPYINALMWDTGLDSFTETTKAAAVKKPDGDILRLHGEFTHEFTAMCPYTSLYQDTIHDLSERLIDPKELDFDGIYYDQMGGHRPDLCYDASHGHPLGGGSHWTDGYRTMLERIEKTVSDNAYYTLEMFTEPYVDYMQGFLGAHLERNDDDVPLVQAIYSGYATSVGRFENKRDPADTFATIQGDSFVWGIMPGWFKPTFQYNKEKLDLAVKLSRYRMAAKDFLVYGELVGEVQILPKADKIVRTVYGPYFKVNARLKKFKPLQGSIWRTYDGKSLGIVVMNMDSKPRRATFSVDIQQWLKNGNLQELGIYRILPQGIVFEQLTTSESIERDLALDAHEVLLLAIRPVEIISKVKLVTPVLTDEITKCSAAMAETYSFDREMAKRKLDIHLENNLVEALYTSSIEAVITIANNGNSNQKLQISWPDNTTEEVVLNRKQNTTLKHKIQLAQNKAMYEKFEIGIKNSKFVKKIPLYVNLKAPLQVFIEPGQTMPSEVTTDLKLSVQNNTQKAQSGKVEVLLQNDAEYVSSGNFKIENAKFGHRWPILFPEEWQCKSEADFKDLKPGQKVGLAVECKAPYHVRNTIASISAKVNEYEVTEKLIVLQGRRPQAISYFFKDAPAIDGNINEWIKMAPSIVLDGTKKTQVKIGSDYQTAAEKTGVNNANLDLAAKEARDKAAQYQGAADLSMKLYSGWDDENFYFAAKVFDDVFFQQNTNELMWNGDGMQFAFHFGKPNPAKNYDGTETSMTVALTRQGPVVWQSNPDKGVCKTATLSVIRNETEETTIYEGRIPWKKIGLKDVNTPITWSVTINDRDGKNDALGWMEWTPGIGGKKDSSSFGWLKLKK